MRKFKYHNKHSTEDWGWVENPISGKIYTLEEIEKAYGYFVIELDTDPIDTESLISTWEDGWWDEEHGTWEEIFENN